jgi:hypothetical protein
VLRLGLCERRRAPEAETLALFRRLQQEYESSPSSSSSSSSSSASAALTPAQLSFIGDPHFQRHVLARQCNHPAEDPASTLLYCDDSPSFGRCFRCARCQLQLCRIAVVEVGNGSSSNDNDNDNKDAASGQQLRPSLVICGPDEIETQRERGGGGSAGTAGRLPAHLSYLRSSSRSHKSSNGGGSHDTTRRTMTLADLQQLYS